LNSYENKM